MSIVDSNILPLNTVAPDFNLPDVVTGDSVNLQFLRGEKGTIILFICNHCPFVIHIKDQLIAIAKKYAKFGINTIAISANDIANYPQDAPDKMQQLMLDWGYPFKAYLYDESQQVAKSYQASCTPDLYFFGAELSCVYHGRLDASTPKNQVPLTGKDLRNALDSYLAGETISKHQIPSIGCNIKWKAT